MKVGALKNSLIKVFVNRHEAIGYTMEDGRRVDIAFVDQGNETKVIETFDAESSNPVEFQ